MSSGFAVARTQVWQSSNVPRAKHRSSNSSSPHDALHAIIGPDSTANHNGVTAKHVCGTVWYFRLNRQCRRLPQALDLTRGEAARDPAVVAH